MPCPQHLPKCHPHILSSCPAAQAGMALCLSPAVPAAAWQDQAAGRDDSTRCDVAGGVTAISDRRAGDMADPSDSVCSTDTHCLQPHGAEQPLQWWWQLGDEPGKHQRSHRDSWDRDLCAWRSKRGHPLCLFTPLSRGVGTPSISRRLRGEDAARMAQSCGDPRGVCVGG